MLYGANGQVLARSPSRARTADRQDEVAIREKLKSIDSLLDIKYIEWAGRYALICQWPQSDERWKMIQSGEIGEPYDALGWFCTDMQDPSSLPVSIDSIENLILERLNSCDNTRHHWKGRMKDIIEKNAKVRKSRQQEVIDRTQEIAETLHFAAGHVKGHKLEGILREVEDGRV